jgi:hypothetical protein
VVVAVVAHLAVGLLVLVGVAQAAQQVHQELQTRAAVVEAKVAEQLLAQAVQVSLSSRFLTFSVRHSLAVLPTPYRLQAQT